MHYDRNPFPAEDIDRHAIWEMLVHRDIDAYLACDWEAVESDFVASEFFGMDGAKSDCADNWRPAFSTLDSYRDEWRAQADETAKTVDPDKARAALFNLTDLTQIDIDGDFAVAHKKFDGTLPLAGGGRDYLNWQTLYLCKRVEGAWKIRGFLGYIPYPLVKPDMARPARDFPPSGQHKTAGPYSPVLRVTAGSDIVVICGQAPVNLDGDVVGETVTEQSHVTLDNCLTQLKAAGLGFEDVFKVNVYMTDLDRWDEFNTVYSERMSKPYPVRTAVQTGLLTGFLVELEMWAAHK